jgi:two-component system response regulator YesN
MHEKITPNQVVTSEHSILEGTNNEAFDYYMRLRKLKDYVQERLNEKISLKTAADIAAFERTYFSFFFHQKTGIRFADWLRRIRIGRAISLAKQADYSVAELSWAVGFKEVRTFQRAFKKYTNLTPLQFKRLVLPSPQGKSIHNVPRIRARANH